MKLQALNENGRAVKYGFWCPGCKESHRFRVALTEWEKTHKPNEVSAHYKPSDTWPIWTFNGNEASPTFQPSLKYSDDAGVICHLYLTNGMIQFLGDCRHDLKGKTIPLQEIPS